MCVSVSSGVLDVVLADGPTHAVLTRPHVYKGGHSAATEDSGEIHSFGSAGVEGEAAPHALRLEIKLDCGDVAG